MANANPSGPSATASQSVQGQQAPVVKNIVKEPKMKDFKKPGQMGEDKMHKVVEDNDKVTTTQLRSGTLKISRK